MELFNVLGRPSWWTHRSLHLMVDERPHEIALRFDLELGGHARRALAAISEGEQAASRGRKLFACLSLRRLHSLEEDRGRVAENERRTEAERPDQLRTVTSRRAAVWADVWSAMLLVPERQTAIGWRRRRRASRPFGRARSHGRPGRIGRKKTLPGGGLFLLRCVVPVVVRILRPAIVFACAVEGELVPWRVAQRRRQARTRLNALQKGFAAFKAAYHLQDRRCAGRAFVGALRQDAPKGPVRRPLRALRIDAAPDAGNGALEGMKPDRRKTLFLVVGGLPRRARHRKDEIGSIDAIGLRGCVEVRERDAAIEQSLDEPPCRRVAAENVVEQGRVSGADVDGRLGEMRPRVGAASGAAPR